MLLQCNVWMNGKLVGSYAKPFTADTTLQQAIQTFTGERCAGLPGDAIVRSAAASKGEGLQHSRNALDLRDLALITVDDISSSSTAFLFVKASTEAWESGLVVNQAPKPVVSALAMLLAPQSRKLPARKVSTRYDEKLFNALLDQLEGLELDFPHSEAEHSGLRMLMDVRSALQYALQFLEQLKRSGSAIPSGLLELDAKVQRSENHKGAKPQLDCEKLLDHATKLQRNVGATAWARSKRWHAFMEGGVHALALALEKHARYMQREAERVAVHHARPAPARSTESAEHVALRIHERAFQPSLIKRQVQFPSSSHGLLPHLRVASLTRHWPLRAGTVSWRIASPRTTYTRCTPSTTPRWA